NPELAVDDGDVGRRAVVEIEPAVASGGKILHRDRRRTVGAAGGGGHADHVGRGARAGLVCRADAVVIGRPGGETDDVAAQAGSDIEVVVAADETAERGIGRDIEAVAGGAGGGAPVGDEAAGGDVARLAGDRCRR